MPRQQKHHHYIYKTTCLVTGKFYVGMHSTDDIDDGYLGSGKILGYSRKKYGDENHKKEILEMCSSREALKLREREIVNEELLTDPLNINLKYGGEGGWTKVSSIAGNKSPKRNFVVIHQKMEQSMIDSGKCRSVVSSVSLKHSHSAAKIKYDTFSGKKHREETKTKIGAANSKHQSGIGNSQFGTCWIIKDVPIKIKRNDLHSYLMNGYRLGRK